MKLPTMKQQLLWTQYALASNAGIHLHKEPIHSLAIIGVILMLSILFERRAEAAR